MNCKQMEVRLIGYVDGKLSPRERAAVELHAQTCAPCGKRLRGFEEVFGLLQEWKGIEPSAGFNARLEQRLSREPATSGWWAALFPGHAPLPFANPVFSLAMLLVVLLAAVVIRFSPASPPTLARRQTPPLAATVAAGVDDLTLYRNLPVLEDLDVLGNFELLQELSSTSPIR